MGERAVMADGDDCRLVLLKDQGQPVEVVHAAEGSPLIPVPSGVFRSAPETRCRAPVPELLFGVEAPRCLSDAFAHILHFTRSLSSVQDQRRYRRWSCCEPIPSRSRADRGDQDAVRSNLGV